MPGHGNFTSVTLGRDDNDVERLTVNGVTTDIDDVDVKAVYVAVAHAAAKTTLLGATRPGDEPHELPSVAVPAPEDAGGWTATLDQEKPPARPYAVGDTVLLVGVIVDSHGEPTFWHNTLEIEPG